MPERIFDSKAARGVIYAVIAGAMAGLGVTTLSLTAAQEKVVKNAAIIGKTETLVSDMKDVETGVRGYVLTEQEAFLEPYRLKRNAYIATGRELGAIIAQAGGEAGNVDNLIESARKKTELSDRIVELANQKGFDSARALVLTGQGRALMDELRQRGALLQSNASSRISEMEQSTIARLRWALGFCFVVLIFGVLYLLASAARSRSRVLTAQKMLSDTIESAPVGMALVNQNGVIIKANPAFSAVTGFFQASAESHSLGSVSGPISRALAMDLRGALDRGAHPPNTGVATTIEIQEEERTRYVDGLVFPVRITLGEGPESRGAGIVVTDITRQREWEIELERARDEAASANRAKSAFIANMSHELRTPLTAVLGYAELLGDELSDLGQKDLLADLGKININARHLLGLINDVLDLSKIEAQKMDVHAVDISLGELISRVEASVGSLVAKNGNEFHVKVDDAALSLHSDDLKIKQILLNLVGNASKFTSRGKISLSAGAEQRRGRPYVRFEVTDTGIGMSSDQVANLFQRFSQADESTTRKFGGTGLGLALTRALTIMLGGEIEVESAPGKGSTFRAYIPQVYAPPTAQLAALDEAASSAGFEGPDVLIVDDDPAARDILKRLLTKEGFSVRTATDGQEALAAARARRPLAILLDVMLPGMDGWHVLRELRADPTTATIPVIIQTVLDDANFAYAMGASGFLKKPIEKQLLSDALEDVVANIPVSGHVLIVDDDVASVERVGEMLRRDGWAVEICNNGADALASMHASAPSLVLVDLVMPEMDGYAFIRRVRSNSEWDSIPIVVLTAEDISNKRVRELARDTSDIVQKGNKSLADLVADLRKFSTNANASAAQ